jgi:hypothetical protein
MIFKQWVGKREAAFIRAASDGSWLISIWDAEKRIGWREIRAGLLSRKRRKPGLVRGIPSGPPNGLARRGTYPSHKFSFPSITHRTDLLAAGGQAGVS